ncbi:cob(I)yrinic acid a,c-diamide adenosyltransferase [Desulfovibrio sp. OttesenSCG-928-M14]|nr:cob(I)yrinic acid a,c-diamide adenosyltransferase [Desulfovibrio sp. OttesenSCG-928-M16]MDL2216730.1 cob(I)yrinic acid a,c-diamide adenosyltransferase [Desulfovibrio sp. OttesenSCG-928-M14]
MIVIYTGEGKGKTSACVGQAVRAHGQGLRVFFAQFMKRPGQAGEQAVLAALLGDNYLAGGPGFFRHEAQRPAQREAALAVLASANKALECADMLVLDEALYALGSKLLQEDELKALITAARAANVHLVLSGRGLPGWLEEKADIVTEMQPVRHAYQNGQSAVKGIEY